MRSTQDQLNNRGFIIEEIESRFENTSFEEKVEFLKSKEASKRTLGARLLKKYNTLEAVNHLINALKVEKKLYSKIEICNSLSALKAVAVKPLISSLGQIGNNQHKEIPDKAFSKDSYPLPRDIASRTLIRIGRNALPQLINELETQDKCVLSELIDTIGHINFYSNVNGVFERLKSCYISNGNNDLIKWKIIRAMGGIRESESFLMEQYSKIQNTKIKREIDRSVRLIKGKKGHS